ncbi:SDR family oxidoreductase [Akkermansiaceae bacterium]|nr:SDR family oxidoreductase [Akkermansiaceae bacterium]
MKWKKLISIVLVIAATVVPSFAEDKKVVVITGANRGLGLEFAKQYVAKGYEVYGTARKPEEATDLKAAGAQVLQLDVLDDQSIANMAQALKDKKVDVLINNAGYMGPIPLGKSAHNLAELTREEMDRCLGINTIGPLMVTQALLPNLLRSEMKKVINISSRSGILDKSRGPGGERYGYKVSKTALNMVTKIMSGDKSMKGLIIVSMAPGHNKTDMGTDRAKLSPDQSIPKVIDLITNFTKKDSGKFIYYTGVELPW